MNEFLFIRHAETDMAGTFCGHSDPPINLRGAQQIRDLIESLKSNPLGMVYCSDLQRATATAHAISDAFNIDVVQRSGLREINFGEWEGLSWQQIEQRDPHYARRWIEDFPNLPAPGGEIFADFKTRVLAEVNQLPLCPSNKLTAVVTHAGVMRIVLSALQGCTQQEAWDRTKFYCATLAHHPTAALQECGL